MKEETAYYQENFNTSQFKWIAYGAFGYGATYDEAHEDAKRKVYRKCKEENPHLNFDEVITYKGAKVVSDNPVSLEEILKENNDTQNLTDLGYHSARVVVPTPTTFISLNQPEKINKGTIEEQIQDCKTIDELNGWAYIAKSNAKLQEVYHKRLAELQSKKIDTTLEINEILDSSNRKALKKNFKS